MDNKEYRVLYQNGTTSEWTDTTEEGALIRPDYYLPGVHRFEVRQKPGNYPELDADGWCKCVSHQEFKRKELSSRMEFDREIPALRFSVARDGSFTGNAWSYALGKNTGVHLILPPNYSDGWTNAATYTDLYLDQVRRIGNVVCGRATLQIDGYMKAEMSPWSALILPRPNGAPAGLMHWTQPTAEQSPTDLHQWSLLIEQWGDDTSEMSEAHASVS